MKQNIKTNITLAVLLLASSLSFYSCEENKDDVFKGFELGESDYSFSENGGLEVINILTDKAWSAKTDADWLIISPASGFGSAECELKVDSSYTYNKRTAKVFIQTETESKVITVSQSGYEEIININESQVNVNHYENYDDAVFEVEVTSNVAYEIELSDEDKSWLTLESKENSYSPTSATPRMKSFKFRYSSYTDFRQNRIGTINFVQKGGQNPIKTVLTVDQNKAPKIIPSRAGDSLALLSIQNQLNVYGKGWDPSRPITHWDNIITETVDYTYIDEDLGIERDTTELRVLSARFFIFNTKESLPSDVKYLTEAEVLIFIGNENGTSKTIDLGPEITTLKNLKSLAVAGYGICSLPEEMASMDNLEEIEMYGNTFLTFPIEIISKMKNLKYLNFSSNRRVEFVTDLNDIPTGYFPENIGLRGQVPIELFSMNSLEYLSLSYNYLEGSIPDLPVGTMPQLKSLSLNLNRLTGEIPEWILQHERLACWNPFLMVFNQEGKDSKGTVCGFTNEPKRLPNPDCPDWEEEKTYVNIYLSPSIRKYDPNYMPLSGNWRNFKYNYIK